MENRFLVAEKFCSINGEARRAGELAVFIRFAGCNLRCSWCDTAWAIGSDTPGQWMSSEEIYDYIISTGIKNVTLTGGEPLLQKDMERLLQLITSEDGLRTEIETNGAVDICPLKERFGEQVSFTVDYKCPGSGMESYMLPQNFSAVDENDTVKFLVAGEEDLDRMREIITQYGLLQKTAVYVSSVFGSIEPRNVVDYMMKHKLNDVRLQLQMHKFIWPPDMRGV